MQRQFAANTKTTRFLQSNNTTRPTCSLLRSSETNVTGARVFRYVSISYDSINIFQRQLQKVYRQMYTKTNLFV